MELKETLEKKETAVLVGANFATKEKIEDDLEELCGLAKTAEVDVVGRLVQPLREHNTATFIGKGKVEELKELVNVTGASLVIFDEELSGSQIRNLEDAVGVRVIDRSTLILDIFAGRAKTSEGKLQVELTQLKYRQSRLTAISESYGRYGGGVGMRGAGETKLELNKRIARDRIHELNEEISRLKSQRALMRKQRIKTKQKVVAIVGYTNAGKSTLLNALSKADVYADDKLFATLDTTARQVALDYLHKFLLVDTVGFIDKLPHELIDAFQATLEEACSADLILHVVDRSDPFYQKHIEVANNVLNKIGAGDIPKMLVYNKIDKVQDYKDEGVFTISAKNKTNLDELKMEIIKQLFEDMR